MTPIRLNTLFTSFVVGTKFSALDLSGFFWNPLHSNAFSDIVIQVRRLFGVGFGCSIYISWLDGNSLRIAHIYFFACQRLLLFSLPFFVDLLRFCFNLFIHLVNCSKFYEVVSFIIIKTFYTDKYCQLTRFFETINCNLRKSSTTWLEVHMNITGDAYVSWRCLIYHFLTNITTFCHC